MQWLLAQVAPPAAMPEVEPCLPYARLGALCVRQAPCQACGALDYRVRSSNNCPRYAPRPPAGARGQCFVSNRVNELSRSSSLSVVVV
jgi:hypothetical protein